MATDKELNPTNLPLFKRNTKPYAGASLIYVDMRGNAWRVWWDLASRSWSTAPVQAVYDLAPGKLAFFGERADMLIDAVEGAAEEYRVRTKATPTTTPVITPRNEGGGLLLVLAVLFLLTAKGKR